MTASDAGTNGELYANYVYDLGVLVREMALEAKAKARVDGSAFDAGYVAGFHRIVSLMQQQAEAFGIPIEKIGLDGIDPDRDLV
ncbi:MAG: hypothetical protein RL701_7769 [Pseudomonadota bacterium]